MEVTLERLIGVSVRDRKTPAVTKIMRIRIDGMSAGTVGIMPGSRINLRQWGWTPAELAEITEKVTELMGQECGDAVQPKPPPEDPQISQVEDLIDDDELEGAEI